MGGWHYNTSKFEKPKSARELKQNTMEKSCKTWINGKAHELMGLVGLVSKEHFVCILKMIVHRSGLLIVDHDEILLSDTQCVAVRDHVGTGTNGTYQLASYRCTSRNLKERGSLTQRTVERK